MGVKSVVRPLITAIRASSNLTTTRGLTGAQAIKEKRSDKPSSDPKVSFYVGVSLPRSREVTPTSA